jgi:transposase-like protein
MKADEREKHWREVLGRQRQGGLSVRAFCRQEGICEATLYAWRRRLEEKRRVSFSVVRVRPEPMSPMAALELILPGGERLQIAAGIDIGTLRTVLAALRERA